MTRDRVEDEEIRWAFSNNGTESASNETMISMNTLAYILLGQ